MTIPGRRHWALWHMERGLRRSDPHLAAMLAIFVRLTVGEAITSPEQETAARRRIRRALSRLSRVLIAVAAGVSARARRAICRIGLACAKARSRFRGSVRRTAGLPSDRRLPGFPGFPGCLGQPLAHERYSRGRPSSGVEASASATARSVVAAACRVDGGQRGRAGHGHDACDQGDQACAL
jgi:hypothetical protein